jgi:hypothetical protein
MVTEFQSALLSLQAAINIGKAMIDIRDAAAFQTNIIDFQRAIIEAQNSAIQANSIHAAQVERVRQLEKEMADMKAWEAEKQRYELKPIDYNVAAYMLKPNARGTEPPHWACQACYEDGKKRLLQPQQEVAGRYTIFRCNGCRNEVRMRNTAPKWLD